MTTTINKTCLRFGLGIALLSGFICGKASALTVAVVTSDNGFPAHLVSWTDASGHPRSAVMVDQVSTGGGPYPGYMRRYTYVANGVTRVCTGLATMVLKLTEMDSCKTMGQAGSTYPPVMVWATPEPPVFPPR